MPEVAAGESEAVLSTWEVTENDAYVARDVIATVETDKAVVEVEAEADGILLRTLVEAGAAVETGSAIALIGTPGESVEDLDAVLADLGVDSANTEPGASAGSAEAGTVTREASGGGAPAAPEPPTLSGESVEDHAGARVFASPLARRLARQYELPVESIGGTGPGGRIVRRDVEHAASVAADSSPVDRFHEADTSTAKAGKLAEPSDRAASYTERPHSRLRRAIAARLTASKQTVPHFYLRGTAQADRLLAMRTEINTAGTTKVSVNDLIIKAMAQAHRIVPDMNVSWTDDAVRTFDSVDIAVAVATDSGLVTPVIRGVDQLSVSAVAEKVRDYAARARSGHLRQQELEGGTISVTNLGMYGTEDFDAIINPPHAAILAVGAARPEAVVDRDESLSVATVLHVTLSVDHRPVDGVVAARWMKEFLALLESPARILA